MTSPVTHKPIRVLVIDDEPGLRDMLNFGLTDCGYHVATAASGEEGIDMVRHGAFALVVCDIMMPGKDGVEVLEIIKNMQPEIEVIIATGFATLESAVESMRKGAFDYITKPYSLDQLCLIFEKALEHRRLKKRVDGLERLIAPMQAILECVASFIKDSHALDQTQKEELKRLQGHAEVAFQLVNGILE